MHIHRGIAEAIGNTPLIKLKRASEQTGCTILGKAEFMNPGQSVKDRAALFIIEDAVKSGRLRRGGIVVEGTAGNTGIGLALVGNALGFRSVIVIPDTQSQEKKDMLRLCGAELVEVPAVPYSNPEQLRESVRPACRRSWPRQSRMARFGRTSSTMSRTATAISQRPVPKSGDQTDGKIDGFVASVGTGGTLAGVGIALKERNASIKIALADPMGAALYSYYTSGVLKSEGTSITEGIGQGRITKNLEGAPVDMAFQIPDAEALSIIFDLLEHEGLCVGGSTGINVAGAIRLARALGPGHTIVTVLCDYGTRYQTRLFNPEFLRSKGLPVARMAGAQIETPSAVRGGLIPDSALPRRSAGRTHV